MLLTRRSASTASARPRTGFKVRLVAYAAVVLGLPTAACGDGTDGARAVYLAPPAYALSSIVAGVPSTLHDFPATGVILYHSDDTQSPMGAMLCSGTLVASDVVLAAGHCQEQFAQKNGPTVQYYFSLAQDVSSFGPMVQHIPPDAVPVRFFLPHPDYDSARPARGLGRAADLGLFFLSQAVTSVEPAKLATRQSLQGVVAGTKVTIVGYGRRLLTHFGRRDEGIKHHGESTIQSLGRYEMQVGSSGGDALKCHGDSGGPTYLQVDGPDGQVPTVIGITSRAQDWAGCSTGGIDTRVDAYLTWIENSLEWGCDQGLRCSGCGGFDIDLTRAMP